MESNGVFVDERVVPPGKSHSFFKMTEIIQPDAIFESDEHPGYFQRALNFVYGIPQ